MDCTNAFEDVGHSASAYEMLKEFYIGDLVESKSNEFATDSNTNSTISSKKCQNSQ